MVGDHDATKRDKTEKQHSVRRMIAHENYTKDELENDIGKTPRPWPWTGCDINQNTCSCNCCCCCLQLSYRFEKRSSSTTSYNLCACPERTTTWTRVQKSVGGGRQMWRHQAKKVRKASIYAQNLKHIFNKACPYNSFEWRIWIVWVQMWVYYHIQ